MTVKHEQIVGANSLQKIGPNQSPNLMETELFSNSVSVSDPTKKGNEFKTNWAFPLQLLLVVILPFIAAVIYFGFIASDRYVSGTSIVIQSAEMGSVSGIAGLLGASASPLGGGSGSQGDILVSYIHSATILDELEKLLSLRLIFSPEHADPLSAFNIEDSKEDFLDYYRDKVLVEWDPGTNLLSVEVEAFTPQDATLILNTIIMLSEEKLNSLTDRKQKDRVAFAKKELNLAENRLSGARMAVTEFRRKYGEIDPTQSAQATGSLLASLQSERAKERTTLSALLYVMKSTSPQVQTVKSRISAIEKQIKIEKNRATNSTAGSDELVLSDLVSEFEELMIEEEFSRTSYTSALSFFETTRAQAQQDSSYVVDFIPANLPEEATQPRRIQIILSVLVVCLLLLGIGKLIIAAIREQARL